MGVHVLQKDALAKAAGETVNLKLGMYTTSPKLLLLSGGSSFSILPHIDTSLIGSTCTIAMSDDRYSTDKKINNFSLLKETDFYKKAKENGAVFVDTSIQNNESIDDLRERFENDLRVWQKRGGAIIATMGMGPDGHTCGMMPFPENPELFEQLFESKNIVAGYDAGDKNEFPLRVTITMTLVLQINHAIVYVQGENKRDAIERAFSPDSEIPNTPATIWTQMNDVELFTDIEF